MAIIKAFIDAIKYTFIKKKFYKKLLAYACVIGGMKYEENTKDIPIDQWKANDKYWASELPSIYNLDDIAESMNEQHDSINKTFKLDVDEWNRDEVRSLMNAFAEAHNGFSRINGKEFTLTETALKIKAFIDESFWQSFKSFYAIHKEDID